MKLTYCDGWFDAEKCYTELWSEEHARAAHDSGERYTVLVGEPERPDCFLDVKMGEPKWASVPICHVTFLDEHLRCETDYQFSPRPNGRYFLKSADVRVFDGETDRVSEGVSFNFEESGKVRIEHEDFDKNVSDVWYTYADVTPNWEDPPTFGHYEGFCRPDRTPSVTK